MKLVSVTLAAALASAVLPRAADAAVSYSHTSAALNTVQIYGNQTVIPVTWFPFSTPTYLSFSFQTASVLPANLNGADIAPLVTSWQASTSGVAMDAIGSTVAGSSIYFMTATTNAAGDITNWNFGFDGPTVAPLSEPLHEAVRSTQGPTSLNEQIQFLRANNLTLVTLPAGPAASRPALTAVLVGDAPTGGAAVPEPASLLMLGAGLAALRVTRRRRA